MTEEKEPENEKAKKLETEILALKEEIVKLKEEVDELKKELIDATADLVDVTDELFYLTDQNLLITEEMNKQDRLLASLKSKPGVGRLSAIEFAKRTRDDALIFLEEKVLFPHFVRNSNNHALNHALFRVSRGETVVFTMRMQQSSVALINVLKILLQKTQSELIEFLLFNTFQAFSEKELDIVRLELRRAGFFPLDELFDGLDT